VSSFPDVFELGANGMVGLEVAAVDSAGLASTAGQRGVTIAGDICVAIFHWQVSHVVCEYM
jgi:hypothetical protein